MRNKDLNKKKTMKKLTFLSILILLVLGFSSTTYSQKKIRNLKVFVTPDFNSKSSITVEGLTNDNEGVSNSLRSALLMGGFKVISERVAKEKLELKNSEQVDNTTFKQEVSLGKTTYVNSVYIVSMQYSTVAVIGCGNGVGISNISGQIIDLLNDGNIVATFTYKMSMLSSQCADTLMESLVDILKKGKSVK
jgi:hypothetical protein